MEISFLVWVHSHAAPPLDAFFRITQWAGGTYACGALALIMTMAHWVRGNKSQAGLWMALGASTFALYIGLKHAIGRARPELWPWLIAEHGFSFPSGHAIGTATFYPLLAMDLSMGRPSWRRPLLGAALLGVALVGYGRLYLGVHWPTDVLGGWAIGAAQLAAGLEFRRKTGYNR